MHDQCRRIGRGALRRLILFLALTLAAPAQAATRGYTITSFDTIRLEAPVRVEILTGVGPSARADGDQALLDRLRVEVSGRLLTISIDRVSGEKRGGAATLRLSTGDLRRIVLTGGGSVAVNRMKGLAADIMIGGSGDVTIAAVDLDKLTVGLAGSGRVTLAGRAGEAVLRVTGPGAVEAGGLRARQLMVANEGPGTIAAMADVTAKVSSAGSGEVVVTGTAACVVENKGTGRVMCGGEEG